MIDGGYATYPRLLAIRDRLVLIYARGKSEAAGGRDLVFRTSDDDGDRWSAARMLVRAAPGDYVYGTRAVASGDRFCLAYSLAGPVGGSVTTRTRLSLVCSDGEGGGIKHRRIMNGGARQDLIGFDVAMQAGRPRVAFAACERSFDQDQMWADCPGYVATLQGNRWSYAGPGMMASARMPGGMSFDPADPDRLAFVERYRADAARIVIMRFGTRRVIERTIATKGFPTMPFFVDFPRPSFLWSEMDWFRTPDLHHMRLMGDCRTMGRPFAGV